MKTCTVENCENKVIAKGWCSKHYMRNYKHGDPLAVLPSGRPTGSIGMTDKTKRIVAMHESGMSCAEIGRKLGMKKNSIIVLLRYWKRGRKAPGLDIEEKVCVYLSERGHEIERQRGDSFFDLLMDGKTVDVKSATTYFDKINKIYRNTFDIFHSETIADRRDEIDFYIFVVMNDEGKQLYLSRADQFHHLKKTLNLPNPITKSHKYQFEYIGDLDS